jgi:hypothetical protein
MHRTNFAGLTAPDPDDAALQVDGGSFVNRNPDITDYFLSIGAVTHRHDEHLPLASPTHAASAVVIPSGGSIESGTDLYFGWTASDSYGGETVLSPPTLVSTTEPAPDPSGVLSGVFVSSAGVMPTGTYSYGITVMDAGGGEGVLGPTVTVQRDPGFASGGVLLSGLTGDLITDGDRWRLWRSDNGGPFNLIAVGTLDEFWDYGIDPVDHAATPPLDSSRTRATSSVQVTLPMASGASGNVVLGDSHTTAINLYLSLDGSFVSPALVAVFPLASAGATITLTDTFTEPGAPPEVATSIRGANRIDPDTELIDWHWKRPVATAADLPLGSATASGDVRVTLNDGVPHRFIGGAWGVWEMGGGGDVTVPIETNWGTEPASHVPIWQSAASGDVLWLKGFEQTVNILVMEEPFNEASGSIGDLYDTDGFGNAIPTASGVNHNAIHYPAMTPTWALLFDGYVERTFTLTASASHFTRIGVTLGTGRIGLFAWITQAGNLEIAVRTVDTDDDADFTIIATDALPGVPANGDTYNVHFERVGNHLHATVFQSKSVVAECEADIPVPMQADFGTDVDLQPGLSDRWLNADAWTTDVVRAVFYDRRRNLYVEGVVPGGSTNVQILFDGIGDRVFNLGTQDQGVYSAGWADQSGVEASFLRNSQGRVFLSGRSVKSAGAAPVAEDVIVTLDEQARPIIEVLVPVVTGDDNGMQLGMVRIDAGGNVRWVDGASSTPATFHPYVCFDGISYSNA